MGELNGRIKEMVEAWGADFFGVADLSLAYDMVLDHGGPVVAGFPRAISIGIRLMDAIVDQLPRRQDRAVSANYRHHAYDLVNRRLDDISSRLSSVLQREGRRVLPVQAAGRVDDERLCGMVSHKLVAHLSGLGWIGKSCLLVTPQAGPRVRWTTILTDAPLQSTGAPMDERCGTCDECVAICPVGAFTGEPFRESEPREVRYDARKCKLYKDEIGKSANKVVCGMCVYVCPYGRKS
jgi:epoxyqueuosine reductase